MTIDRELMKKLRSDIEEQLALIGKKSNVDLTLGTGHFSDQEASFKINIRVQTAPGELTIEEQDYDHFAPLYGFPPRGTEIKIRNTIYTVSGYRRNARVNKIVIKDAKGKSYVTFPEQIIHSMIK